MRYGIEVYKYEGTGHRIYLCWGQNFWSISLPF